MNPHTGEILDLDVLKKVTDETERRRLERTFTQPIDPANLSRQNRQQLERTGRTQISRNSKCPCGSGKRFKRCCMQAASGVAKVLAFFLAIVFLFCADPIPAFAQPAPDQVGIYPSVFAVQIGNPDTPVTVSLKTGERTPQNKYGENLVAILHHVDDATRIDTRYRVVLVPIGGSEVTIADPLKGAPFKSGDWLGVEYDAGYDLEFHSTDNPRSSGRWVSSVVFHVGGSRLKPIANYIWNLGGEFCTDDPRWRAAFPGVPSCT